MIIMRKLTEMSQEERTNELNYWVAEKTFYSNSVKLYKEALDCLKNLDNDYLDDILSYNITIVYEDGDWGLKNSYSSGIVELSDHTNKESCIEKLEQLIECAEHTADYANEKINEIMYIEREYIDL